MGRHYEMKEGLNKKLVVAILNCTPSGVSSVDLVKDILNIGKESAYRRLRGDINFSWDEIALIASKLGFSLDAIIGCHEESNAVLDLFLMDEDNSLEALTEKLIHDVEFIRQLRINNPEVKVRMVMNTLSSFSIFRHQGLSKFYIYKWICQTTQGVPNIPLSQFEIPVELLEVKNSYVSEIQKLPYFILTMDPNVYRSSVLDIGYFHTLNLINDDELEELRDNLLNSVDNFEKMATAGLSNLGAKVEFYLSAVDIDAPYSHLETQNNSFSRFPVYSIYSLDSKDIRLGNVQKGWIDSLKRFSISVSQCGEIERCKYFNKQRSIIRDMCAQTHK